MKAATKVLLHKNKVTPKYGYTKLPLLPPKYATRDVLPKLYMTETGQTSKVLHFTPRHWSYFARRLSSVAEAAPPPTTRPLPPPRIKRAATDILRALAATVGHDPTAAHYKYHDDPFLIPQSNFRKRAFALSQEAGRKAAAWVRDQHPELFTLREWDPPTKKKTEHSNAEPKIAAYAPKPVYNQNSKVTLEDLRYTTDNALVEDSITVFKLLGGVTAVDRELTLSLLELLCFYNEREPDSAEWLEERWFATSTGRERQASTWKTGGLAEEIFQSLEKKDARAYCAIIQGMAKYYQAERAYQLSREALEAGLSLSVDAYNTLLGCVGFMREGVELRTQQLTQLLKEMQELGVEANSETLNACLRSVSAWGGGRILRKLALQLVAEFRTVGVQPSLSAYYHLLCIFCKERGPKTDILTSILTDLETRPTLDLVEPTDTHFFITALAVCNDHLQDMALADRVHALLMRGDNYKLLGDGYKESIYYRHLVTVSCKSAPLDRTVEILDQLVPHVYVPEPSVMDEIIKALEAGGAGARLADAWSQLVVFGHARRIKLVERLAAALVNCYHHQEEAVKERMRKAAREMLHFGDEDPQDNADKRDHKPPQEKLSASALTHIIEVCSDAAGSEEDWAAAAEAARRLQRGEAPGAPRDLAPLLELPGRAIARGQMSDIAPVLLYLAECAPTEASAACVDALATALNRSGDEVLALLRESRSALSDTLHPELSAVVDAYRMSAMGETEKSRERESTSSESDSETSESDSERE